MHIEDYPSIAYSDIRIGKSVSKLGDKRYASRKEKTDIGLFQ